MEGGVQAERFLPQGRHFACKRPVFGRFCHARRNRNAEESSFLHCNPWQMAYIAGIEDC
jgi:hypothetical protein